jgi:hypothetical protein
LTRSDLYRVSSHAERASQRANQLFISCAINRWRRNPNPQSAVVLAHDLAARSPRDNLNFERELSVLF